MISTVFQHNDSYSATKAEAEALVIKSNGKGGLLTCCIRPSSIFGPGDKLLVPSLVAAARAGKSKVLMSFYCFEFCIYHLFKIFKQRIYWGVSNPPWAHQVMQTGSLNHVQLLLDRCIKSLWFLSC